MLNQSTPHGSGHSSCWNVVVLFVVAVLGLDKIPLWGTFIISFGCGAISAVVIRMFVVPWQRRRIKGWSLSDCEYVIHTHARPRVALTTVSRLSYDKRKLLVHLYLLLVCQGHNTHPFNGPLSRTTRAIWYQKGKPICILLKQETRNGSGICWAICKSAPRSRQITMPAPHHSVFYRPDALPAAQPTASKH